MIFMMRQICCMGPAALKFLGQVRNCSPAGFRGDHVSTDSPDCLNRLKAVGVSGNGHSAGTETHILAVVEHYLKRHEVPAS